MGKLNEIQEQTTQSWGDNSFTTSIKVDTVEFDSAKDSFTFNDPVEVPGLKINGTEIATFDAEDKAKLDSLTTTMQVKGRIDDISDLPDDASVGDVYLVGLSGGGNFEEYVCVEVSGSPATPVWENLGHVKAQSDWNQSNNSSDNYIKNKPAIKAGQGSNSIIEGNIDNNVASDFSHAEGWGTTASGIDSHAEGQLATASGSTSHAEGYQTQATAPNSHAEGVSTKASGPQSHAEGSYTTATNSASHAEGNSTKASGYQSHAEGSYTTASGQSSHAEGNNTTASKEYSHAEGDGTTASGQSSHAEGTYTTASGNDSHTEGNGTTASGSTSHAEGGGTTASGYGSHAEGGGTKASGPQSHAEGGSTTASGPTSHAEGSRTTATGESSHTEGNGTIANNKCQHVFGEYNGVDPSSALSSARGTYIEIVGNGATTSARSNARTLDWSGNEVLTGKITANGVNLNDALNLKQDALGFTPENSANKKTTLADNSDTYYPTQKAVKIALDAKVDGPVSSTANDIPVYADETGKLLKGNTGVSILDGKIIAGGVDLNAAISELQQSQSDWNQFDSESQDFVKNRPFYEDIVGEVVVTGTPVGGNIYFDWGEMIPVVGKSYLIEWGTDNNEDGIIEQGTAEQGTAQQNTEYSPDGVKISFSQGGVYYNPAFFSAEGHNVNGKFNGNPLVRNIRLVDSVLQKIDTKFIDGYMVSGTGVKSNKFNDVGTNVASGNYSHAEGDGTTASNACSHAEGNDTTASGSTSHAEGYFTKASGPCSHAECYSTTASGGNSHAEGGGTTASGSQSHAEGQNTTASGTASHAEGYQTTANHKSQHVFGEFNTVDPSSALPSARGNYVEIVGNGATSSAKSNARTLDWSGNENIAGMLRIGSSATTGGCLFKVDGTSLKISFDDGTTWLTVSAS